MTRLVRLNGFWLVLGVPYTHITPRHSHCHAVFCPSAPTNWLFRLRAPCGTRPLRDFCRTSLCAPLDPVSLKGTLPVRQVNVADPFLFFYSSRYLGFFVTTEKPLTTCARPSVIMFLPAFYVTIFAFFLWLSHRYQKILIL